MSGAHTGEPVANFGKALRLAAGLERGAITALLALSLSGLTVVFSAVLSGFQVLIMQERVIAVIDLAALAAADTQRGLVSGIVCENAESILKTVDAVMTTCRIVGDGVMVSGQLRLPLMTLQASATAGEE